MSGSITYRRVVSIYLIVAATVAVGRVALYLWLVHRYVTHTVTDTVIRLGRLEYPEESVAIHTGIASIENKVLFVLVFAVMLAVGSFVFLSPVLLMGILRRRTRQSA